MKNIIHLTTVHTRTDIRIRVKQTASLAGKLAASVALFVQDGKGFEADESSGVQVVDTGPKFRSRVMRMTLGAWRMLRAVQKARPDVAHFHDPELIPVGLTLKLSGIKVVYDVHEDVPRQILTKYYLPAVFRKPAAWFMEAVEWIAGMCFDAIVPATPKIAMRFPAGKTVVVQNFPILEELVAPQPVTYEQRPPDFAYVGGITRARGAMEMVEASGLVSPDEARLRLAGAFSPKNLQSEIEALPGWDKV
ncbi:MAG: glycosyltransferase, partial [Clostridiales bacterium]|nr:glycosyltransferase [Clostridiales bacterium]